jgi:hypothetical protein
MKVYRGLGILLALACFTGIIAQPTMDTIWLVRNTDPEILWVDLGLADTFPDNRGKFSMVDTGDAQDGTPYINFDYQFGNPHPGYAGFKIYWDNGIMSYYVESHDSLTFWYKGPLPGHKVKMVWAQGSAGCGTPINYQDYYEFTSSPVWKRVSFGFPPGFVRNGLFELRMLIYNETGTSETSDPGCLKIDNMFFFKNTAGVKNHKLGSGATGSPRYFVPKVSGNVMLTIFSLQGEQLFSESIPVSAGKKYDANQFARKNSNLPAKWIHCVQITGAGVNITRKVFE